MIALHDPFGGLASQLADGLLRPLPGAAAHERLAPRPRRGWQPGVVPAGCRDSAALVLLYPVEGEARLLLTVRSGTLPLHAGQVSLPGGALEVSEDPPSGALREAREEVGLDPRDVDVLGRLTPLHIPVSGFVLHPVVGIARGRPRLAAHPPEVERILEPRVTTLLAPSTLRVETRTLEGRTYRVPYLAFDGVKLWGATAMVVSELLALLGEPLDPWDQRTP